MKESRLAADTTALRERVFERMPLGVVLLRLEERSDPGSLRLVLHNETANRMTGGLVGNVIGRTIREAFPKLLETDLPETWVKAVVTNEGPSMREIRYGDERIAPAVYQAWAMPIGDDLLVISFENVTDTAEAAARRDQTERQVHAAQRLEAIGLLAGGIAHDFNNVLTVIQSCSGFLLEDLPAGHSALADVAEIREAAQRAARLTDQLLAFSRRQPQKLRILGLNEILSELDKMLRRIIGEDVDLVTKLDPALGNVQADRAQVEQVLMNLAINARDAMPNGGNLTIETANVDLDDGYAVNKGVAVPAGGYVMLAVSDSGIGMDAETQARAFEPFFTRNKKKGTGLGLSTVYGIVKQSDGHIWIYSEPGKGTTFKIYLPRITAKRSSPPPRSPAVAQRGSETLLLVEDEATVRRVAFRILKAAGYNVLEAPNGTVALRLAKEHGAPIDLLLTDVVMPSMSGKELATQLSALRSELRVLFMSGYAEGAVVHHGVLEEGTAYLQKPFSRDSLLDKVREVLDRRG